jgi:predicted HTH domain antitoxin
MDTFLVQDLPAHVGDLVRSATAGRLSVVVGGGGQPVFVAVPVDDHLVRNGVTRAIAVKLFEQHVLSIGLAAKLAGMPIEAFAEHVSALGIPVIDYPASELDKELQALPG